MNTTAVLDTSAVFALVDDEKGAEVVERVLRSAAKRQRRVLLSFMTIVETRYVIAQEQDEAAADYVLSLMKAWPVEWIYPDEFQCLVAARLKAAHRLSMADAFIAAAAMQHHAVLVHKDPEFDQLGDELEREPLPYK